MEGGAKREMRGSVEDDEDDGVGRGRLAEVDVDDGWGDAGRLAGVATLGRADVEVGVGVGAGGGGVEGRVAVAGGEERSEVLSAEGESGGGVSDGEGLGSF